MGTNLNPIRCCSMKLMEPSLSLSSYKQLAWQDHHAVLDASGWRRLCTSFSNALNDLCTTIAYLTRRICTEYVDLMGLTPLLASHLIALDKSPGVRPIGVGEVLREWLLRLPYVSQLCAGHISGCEAGLHAMVEIQSEECLGLCYLWTQVTLLTP